MLDDIVDYQARSDIPHPVSPAYSNFTGSHFVEIGIAYLYSVRSSK